MFKAIAALWGLLLSLITKTETISNNLLDAGIVLSEIAKDEATATRQQYQAEAKAQLAKVKKA